MLGKLLGQADGGRFPSREATVGQALAKDHLSKVFTELGELLAAMSHRATDPMTGPWSSLLDRQQAAILASLRLLASSG
jgi:hypothetical protein